MYRISNFSGKIKNTSNGEVFVPDSNNLKYQDYVEWLKLENTPLFVDFFEGEEAEHNRQFLPKTVSQRQLRTQLVLNGFNLDNIQNAINTLQEPDKSIAQIAWDYAITFERDSPLLISLGFSLGLSQSDIDNIFLNASKL